uniref:DUF2023 domain-containing protein n=1 Tax=uncultured Candidatus Melainabacteria bacterium TaxID=2682970 RepID=A0A650EJB5_9BACT|nr:hypothetical protein Melaina855_1940 [uncultured Candidatus Melainabacteria bacterium]
MELFNNLIYEYKKGIRDMAMYTCPKKDLHKYIEKLLSLKIEYITPELSKDKVNIFFGNIECLIIFKQFSSKELDKLTPYEDFILGIMLGYCRKEQYKRLLGLRPEIARLY